MKELIEKVAKNRQDSIIWVDPVTDRWGNTVYMTCVIDGLMYRTAPNGREYCAGSYKKPDDGEKQVVTPSANSGETISSGVEEVGHNSSEGKTTIATENEGGIMSQKRGPKHKELPQGLIKRMAKNEKSSRVIAQRLEDEKGIKVSYKTIQRILSGQRVLV